MKRVLYGILKGCVWKTFLFFLCTILYCCIGVKKDIDVIYDKQIRVAEWNDTSFYVCPFEIGDTLFVIMPAYWDTEKLCVSGVEMESSLNGFYKVDGGKWEIISVLCNQYYDIKMQDTSSKKLIFYKSKQNGIFIKTDGEVMMNVNNSIDKSFTAKGRLKCFTKEGKIEYNGKLSKIKGRGNWTWSHSKKKPYSIKLKNKSSLLGLLPNKSYNLLSNPFDASFIRNWIALHVAEEIGLPYSIQSEFCSLWTDGEYKGLYLLTEKVHIGKGNIDITDMKKPSSSLLSDNDNTGGYVLEQDLYSSDDADFQSADGMYIKLKSPKQVTTEQLHYIKQQYEDMYLSITSKDGCNPRTKKHYSEYLDKHSFALYYLLQELFYNYDAGFSSVFMFKDRDDIDSLFYAGPLWDMDNTMSPWWAQKGDMQYMAYIFKAGIIPSQNEKKTLFPELCAHTDFYKEVKYCYNENVGSVCHRYFSSGKMDSLYLALKTDICLNNLLWLGKMDDASLAFNELSDFMNKRIEFFDDDMKRENYRVVILDVKQNYPIRRHLMEWHLQDGDYLQLVHADAPGYVWDGCSDSEGKEYTGDSICINKDLKLIYHYREESFFDQLRRVLKKWK